MKVHEIRTCKTGRYDKVPLMKKFLLYIGFPFLLENKAKKSLSSKKAQKKGASYHTYQPQKRESISGSLMVETAIVLPTLVCFMVCFLFLFRVLQVQECVEEALQYSARVTAVNCYADSMQQQTSAALLLAEATVAFEKQLEEKQCPYSFIKNGKMGISLLWSEFGGSDVTLRASYQMEIPVRLFPIAPFRMLQCVTCRKWVGDIDLSGDGVEQQSAWVYITPTGSAYHKSRSCTYLDLSVRPVGRLQVGSDRNASGERYRPCEHCTGSGNTVFITDYGNRYHSSLTCSGLKRTIQMVHLSEVEGRHPCQKCYR